MLQLTLLFVGTLAFLVSSTTILGSVIMEIRGDIRHMVDVLGGFGGAGLWGVFALGSTNIEVVSNGTVVSAGAAPPLTYVAVAFAGLSVIVALVGVSSLVNVLDTSRSPAR